MATNEKYRKIKPLQLIAVIFFTVSGGPYGLEPLLNYVHDHAALLLLLVTPLIWDIPAIFTVLELNSRMPVTGGYYQWVKYALGPKWGFFEGWWTWIYTFADLAIYSVLFTEYAAFFFPEIAPFKIYICLIIVWASAALNIWGIVPVGRISVVLGIAVFIPFLVLFGVFIHHHTGSYLLPSPSLKRGEIDHSDVGQMNLYLNYFKKEEATDGDNEPPGIGTLDQIFTRTYLSSHVHVSGSNYYSCHHVRMKIY